MLSRKAAKLYLEQAKYVRREMLRAREKVREIDMRITSLSSMRYDKDPIQASPVNQMEEGVMQLIEAKDRMQALERKYWQLYVDISAQLDLVDDPLQREVLKQYYLDDRKIRSICYNLNYEQAWVYQLFNKGLDDFSRKMEECKKIE